MRILNAYGGIGGNRIGWGDEHDITMVEYKQEIADIYHDFFPKDKIVVTDAHQYLLDHFEEFDFIWSSPPCPTHSDIRRCGVQAGQYEAKYPDMQLYQEIILLMHFASKKTKWVVENVNPYYKPLIPGHLLHRHLFWSNFWINEFETQDDRVHNDIGANSTVYGINLNKYESNDKRKMLRNMVDPELGKHILNCAMGIRNQQILI